MNEQIITKIQNELDELFIKQKQLLEENYRLRCRIIDLESKQPSQPVETVWTLKPEKAGVYMIDAPVFFSKENERQMHADIITEITVQEAEHNLYPYIETESNRWAVGYCFFCYIAPPPMNPSQPLEEIAH